MIFSIALFFFNDSATTDIYTYRHTLSLHDALPSSSIADIPSPPPIREERRMLAIGLRLLAVICLAIMFAAVKVAGQRGVHVVETLFYRQFLALPLILGWLWMGPGFTSVKTARISAHASSTLVGMIGMVLNFLSVLLLPLAEAPTIGFTVPIFATI